MDFTKPQLLTIDAAYAGQRIDNYLSSRLKGLPKSHLYRILRKGEVRINKKRVKPDYRLQTGDNLRLPPLQLATQVPVTPGQQVQAGLLAKILYEDKNLLILAKPPGMAVHGGSGLSYGVIEALRAARPQPAYLELVHRLDKDTSGCLLIAKKPSVLKQLHSLLREGKVHKVYWALVAGKWPAGLTKVSAPLHKNHLKSGERVVVVNPAGKPALTYFKVLQYFADATLVEASPKTGRTHQIRVHAQYAGHPLVGDEKYGLEVMNKLMRQRGSKRLFLHAASLSFQLPDTQQLISVQAPLPADLNGLLTQLAELR